MVGPIIEELAGENSDKVKIGKCDVDQNKACATKYGVMSIPTVIVFKGGEEVARIVGAREKGEYQAAIDSALEAHELMKLRHVDSKEKSRKREMAAAIEKRTNCEVVGEIGHVLILYRQNKDPKKRHITLPKPG